MRISSKFFEIVEFLPVCTENWCRRISIKMIILAQDVCPICSSNRTPYNSMAVVERNELQTYERGSVSSNTSSAFVKIQVDSLFSCRDGTSLCSIAIQEYRITSSQPLLAIQFTWIRSGGRIRFNVLTYLGSMKCRVRAAPVILILSSVNDPSFRTSNIGNRLSISKQVR